MSANNHSSEPPDAEENVYHVASVDEVAEGERIILEVAGREIAVFHSNGEYHALSNYCPHQGGPVCEGLLSGTLAVEDEELVWSCEDEIVSCPWHGWEFDITDGRHTASDRYRVPTYDLRVVDGELYVEL